jgi:hypothetical protein
MKSNHRHTAAFVLGIVVLGGIVFASKKGVFAPSPSSPSTEKPSTPVEPVAAPEPTPIKEMTYHSIILGTSKIGGQLVEAVGQDHLAQVLSLNRVDIKHLQNGQLIVIPDSYDEPLALSSFPQSIPELATVPKMMFVSQKIQEFALYEHGALIRFGGVSTGKKTTQTPSQLYYTNWKGKSVTSTVDDAWIMPWYFNLDNLEGVSMHQFDLPGYPASHACIRMSEDDAKFIFNWADQWILSKDEKLLASGTPVLIFDTYAYGKTAPWKKLVEDPHATTISLPELEKELQPHIEDIQKKQQERALIVTP